MSQKTNIDIAITAFCAVTFKSEQNAKHYEEMTKLLLDTYNFTPESVAYWWRIIHEYDFNHDGYYNEDSMEFEWESDEDLQDRIKRLWHEMLEESLSFK